MKHYTVLVWELGSIEFVIRGLIKRGARNIKQAFPYPYGEEKLAEVALEFDINEFAINESEITDNANRFLKLLYADNIIAGWYRG